MPGRFDSREVAVSSMVYCDNSILADAVGPNSALYIEWRRDFNGSFEPECWPANLQERLLLDVLPWAAVFVIGISRLTKVSVCPRASLSRR